MSAATHTPGPWSLDHGEDVERGHVGISAKSHSLLAQVVWKMEDDSRTPRAEANAHLIAAAPDLLAALMALKRAGGIWPDLVTMVDAALAKAQGGAA